MTTRRLFTVFLLVIFYAAPITPAHAADSTEPILVFDTPLIQGGLVYGTSTAQSMKINDREVDLDASGRFVFGLGRKASATLVAVLKDVNGQIHTQSFPVTQREYTIQRINGVEKKYVTPPAEVSDRIARERKQVREVRNNKRLSYDYLHKAIWPTEGIVTGVYGSERFYNGAPRSPHYGIDIAAPTGKAVVAPLAGEVTLVDDLYFSGGTLIIDHGRGVSSTFIHLSRVHVSVGEYVEQGQLIADVGASGRVTGPHLDWRMNWFNERLDPALLLPPQD